MQQFPGGMHACRNCITAVAVSHCRQQMMLFAPLCDTGGMQMSLSGDQGAQLSLQRSQGRLCSPCRCCRQRRWLFSIFQAGLQISA